MFIHYGMNTYTGAEWGDGTEDPATFNPPTVDARQWAEIAKETGFKYMILTAKHHDGFCLWPSAHTTHSIKNSPYKGGGGDIVREFADACRMYGVKFGFYLSPWDRHEETYGTEEYNLFFQNQLAELLNGYGEVGEVWLDGANGEGPDGIRQDYNWDQYFATIRHYQPNALIAVFGPDVRWIGNEDGLGNVTEWCRYPRRFSVQHSSYDNTVWYPSECDVSIRPGWFYHAEENTLRKSVNHLVDIYLRSVGRNSNLLLNVPPNREGRISVHDVTRLRQWRERLDVMFADDLFSGQNVECSNTRNPNSGDYSPLCMLDNNRRTFWATDKGIKTADVTISLDSVMPINTLRLEEAIEYGQRVVSFEIQCYRNGVFEKVYEGTTVSRSRIVTFNRVDTDRVRVRIVEALAAPALRIVKGYYIEGIGSY